MISITIVYKNVSVDIDVSSDNIATKDFEKTINTVISIIKKITNELPVEEKTYTSLGDKVER